MLEIFVLVSGYCNLANGMSYFNKFEYPNDFSNWLFFD